MAAWYRGERCRRPREARQTKGPIMRGCVIDGCAIDFATFIRTQLGTLVKDQVSHADRI